MPKTAPNPARKTWCSTAASRLVTSSTATSIASRTSAGTKVTTSANSTMSDGAEPRTAKNSAFLPRMSKSGCARAKPETASNCAPRTAGSRKRRAALARAGVIEDACSTGELLRALDLEPLAERTLERLTVVVGMGACLLAHQQRRDARIGTGRELEHERRSQLREPGQELRHGHVAADRHVVQHGEAERQLRPAAHLERLAL